MPSYAPEPEATGGRRQVALAVVVVLISLVALYLPVAGQQRVAWAIRYSVLRPFIVLQERIRASALRAQAVDAVQAQMDSVTAVMATQSALADENRTLRSLLGLRERVGPSFRPATVIRPGTAGSESMFILDLGARDSVRVGAPVVDRHGLVGVVREVRPATSVGMDWTHPDFRASAMLADGSGYGVVETRRGDFREADRLVLNGAAYYESVPQDMKVLTSGLGGVFPRGIPIGAVDGVADAEGRWRKSYFLRPMVHPSAVTHVLVAVGAGPRDLTAVWPPDSAMTRAESILNEKTRLESLEDSIGILEDRVRALESRSPGPGGGVP
ncbi:MAG TPA: rod shape-determining protein MreC [Longimicrobiales bacterium]|nr:rod shape-determining protein MreC [Longimicrobiales bacterium]